MINQIIDDISFLLKEPFNFDFIGKYGKVFKVYDDQDSGNICFCCEKHGEKLFVKFAGAPTARYDGLPEDAVKRLKATLPIYRDLKHANLIELVESKDVGNGFVIVFKWINGDCMGRMYPESHKRFMELPLKDRLKVFNDILDFFEHMAQKNYVAVDFYDGSIMYDFERGKTIICDIDYFRKSPTVNDMGHMFGSKRFQAPEEFELGAVIDEITNVYTLGATAFALFGGYERTRDKWQLDDRLFEVATKAVSDGRIKRQQSIKQFREEWKLLK